MLKRLNPVTPSTRSKVIIKKKLWKKKPLKSLTSGNSKSGGRGDNGRMTVRGIGGGVKRKYRLIDFIPFKYNDEAEVIRIEYDPNRSTNIMLIKYSDGIMRYELAPQNVEIGKKIYHADGIGKIDLGSSMLLRHMPIGSSIYNIELHPKKGGQISRSAGCNSTLLAKEGKYALVRLKSGEVRKIDVDCRAYFGVLSNPNHQNIVYGKAGARRLLGRRPKVRGVAMNPIDHPHGGGEGKTSGGRHPCSPWGQKAKGKKTRKNKKNNMIVSGRKSKK